MKFKYSVSPNYSDQTDTNKIMFDVLLALLFVAFVGVLVQGYLYGIAGSIRAILIIVLAVVTTTLVDYIYFKVIKTKKDEVALKISENVPAITGIILALTLPVGNLNSNAIFYVTFISCIVAELFGKLIYGGFGYNIFNPAGVGRAFAILSFGKYIVSPMVDTMSSSTPLTGLSTAVGAEAMNQSFTDYTSLIFGNHPGAIGETVCAAIILAGIYLVYKKVIDWRIPVVSMGVLALLATIHALSKGYQMDYVFNEMFSGGLIFAAVFMLTDPVTNPNNKQGKVIFAIIFAALTFFIRFKASLPEGVVFALLLSNLLVPMIDTFTSNVTDKNMSKKYISLLVVLAVVVVLLLLLQLIKVEV